MLIECKKSCDLSPVVLKYARTIVEFYRSAGRCGSISMPMGYLSECRSIHRIGNRSECENGFEGNDFVHGPYTM